MQTEKTLPPKEFLAQYGSHRVTNAKCRSEKQFLEWCLASEREQGSSLRDCDLFKQNLVVCLSNNGLAFIN